MKHVFVEVLNDILVFFFFFPRNGQRRSKIPTRSKVSACIILVLHFSPLIDTGAKTLIGHRNSRGFAGAAKNLQLFVFVCVCVREEERQMLAL